MQESEIRRGPGRPARVSDTALDAGHDITADAHLSEAGQQSASIADDIARIRKIRKPFGAFTQKLALPERPGYHRHWFSDEPGRVDQALASGWAYIKDDEGRPVKRVVGSGRDKGALFGYAMEIPDVFWKEDMDTRHAAAQSKMDEIKKSPFRARPGEAKASDTGKFYSPQENSDPLQIVKG